MKRRIYLILCLLLGFLLVCAVSIFLVININAFTPSSYKFEVFVQGLKSISAIVQPPGESARLFIVEQAGTIRISANGKLLDVPFLNVGQEINAKGNEQGLLGLAFHPQYASNGLFFVAYTDVDGKATLSRFHVSNDPNQADPGSEQILMKIDHPYPNHNGGELAFGPDGYLYYGMGDGGGSGNPLGSGQNFQMLLGSIMRLDVNKQQTMASVSKAYGIPPDNPFVGKTQAAPELWAKGLRNPWRFSFDQKTGDLYIADVGENLYEEIDFQPAKSKGGENYGWNKYEGNNSFAGGDKTGLTFPVATYDHLTGGCAVIGGYVYRGSSLPRLDGTYLYGDYCRGTMWALTHANNDNDGTWNNQVFMSTSDHFTTFGQTNDGEFYAGTDKGIVYKLIAKGN